MPGLHPPGSLRNDLAAVRAAVADTVKKTRCQLAPHLLGEEMLNDQLRPALVFLCGSLCGCAPVVVFPLALAVQYIFLAGVLHRRASSTEHRDEAVKNLILLGDYFYSASFRVLADAGLQHLLPPLARVVQAESESAAQGSEGNFALQAIRNETALLIGESCRLPGVMAAVSFLQDLADFGVNFGMAYGLLRHHAPVASAIPYLNTAQTALLRLPAHPARRELEKLLDSVAQGIFGVEAAATR